MISDVHNGASLAPILFVQTETGTKDYSRDANHIDGELRHSLSGSFPGDKSRDACALKVPCMMMRATNAGMSWSC